MVGLLLSVVMTMSLLEFAGLGASTSFGIGIGVVGVVPFGLFEFAALCLLEFIGIGVVGVVPFGLFEFAALCLL